MTSLKSDLSSQNTGIFFPFQMPLGIRSRKLTNAPKMEEHRPTTSEKGTVKNCIKTKLSTGNETLEGKTLSASSREGIKDTQIPKICVQCWQPTDDHKNSRNLDHLGLDMCSATKTALKFPSSNCVSRRISEDRTAAQKDDGKLRPDDRMSRRRKQSLSLDPQILLQWAATYNDVDTLKSVVESTKADVNAPGVDGSYALHRAASTGSLECLQYLVTKGAQLEVRDKEGSSPLDAAVYEGEFDCARFLIEKGASISHIRDGFTDRNLVKIRGRERVMTFM